MILGAVIETGDLLHFKVLTWSLGYCGNSVGYASEFWKLCGSVLICPHSSGLTFDCL